MLAVSCTAWRPWQQHVQENKAALINVALMLNKVKACDEREGLLLVNASYVSEEFGLV